MYREMLQIRVNVSASRHTVRMNGGHRNDGHHVADGHECLQSDVRHAVDALQNDDDHGRGRVNHDLKMESMEILVFCLAQNLAAVCLSISCRLMARLDYPHPYLHRLYRHLCPALHSYHRLNRNYPLECAKKRRLLLVQVDRDKLDNSLVQTVVVNSLAPISVSVDLAVDNVNANWVEKSTYAVAAVDNHLRVRLLEPLVGHHLHGQLKILIEY